MDLNTAWFVLVGVLLAGYAVLDGFDLGTGPLLLCVRDDADRRVMLNAIGPVWNGNEVWLVTGLGALFAAFPDVYATVCSGFYDAFVLLLAALIFRAAGIEFRGHRPGRRWRQTWDIAFALSSAASAVLLGVLFGNLIWGLPLDSGREFHGGFAALWHPYSLLTGVVTAALFTMHANVYLVLKTEGTLQAKLLGWTRLTVPVCLLCFLAANLVTLLSCPHLHVAVSRRPVALGVIAGVTALVTLNILREVWHGRPGRAFVSSCLSLALNFLLVGVAVYPTLVYSNPDHSRDMTAYNSASTEPTLRFMLGVAAVGAPLVLAYTITVYSVFRGKVRLTDESY